MKRASTTIAALLLLHTALSAQTWQWGRRGGCSFNGVNTQPHEQVKDIATDGAGNVYAIGLVESSGGATVDGHSLSLNGFKDVVLTSFSCNGTYRWSKVIGGASNDLPVAVATDSVGHVYATTLNLPPVNFSGDTTTPMNSTKSIALVAYDTAGNFKWLRQPQPDTGNYVTMVSTSNTYDLHVEGNGDVYWLALLPAGLVSGGNGWALPAPSTCVLHYNVQGTMVDHTVLQMQTTRVYFSSIRMNRMRSGRCIVAGSYDFGGNTGTFSIGGQVINQKQIFMAAFDPAGQNLWKRINTYTGYGSNIFSRPQIDAQGNIYFSGDCRQDDSLNGFAFYNPQSTIPHSVPFVGKADSNGNHLWIKCAGGTSADGLNSLALKGPNEIVLSGTGNSVWWDNAHHIQGAPNCGYYIYTTRFDASGAVLAMDSLLGTFGSDNYAVCNTIDKNGNLYVGGEFNLMLNTGSQSITNAGGASDLFIAKYGYPCSCVAPAPSFSATATAAKTVQFTYGGTTALDSLRWNFGDGQTQKVTSGFTTPLTHTYQANGQYNACVTAYNACGSGSACKTAALSTGTATVDNAAENAVKCYPNPAADYVVLEGGQGMRATLRNSVGQQVWSLVLNSPVQAVSTSGLAAGVYTILLQGPDGRKQLLKLSKL